ncbi:MAG: Fe-S cluster assembly protein SufD [Gammaproteobacteria bacterium]|nr:Fe-S cluster assembly protein SufD [Gammaproteobacteria bacterium]
MSRDDAQTTDLHAVLRSGLAAQRAAAPASDWLSALRERAAFKARSLALPARKDEAWRYTSVAFLDRQRYQPVTQAPIDALQLSDIEELLLTGHAGPRLVFVNGRYAPSLSSAGGTATGVTLTSLGSAAASDSPVLQRHLDQVAAHRHLFSALNSALMADGGLLHVAADADANQEIELLHIAVGGDDPVLCHPRHMLVLESGAHAHVVERYCSLGNAVYFNNALVEVLVGDGAELTHETLQEESAAAQHLNDLHVRLGGGSRYRFACASLGGEWARTDVALSFSGEGGEADLNGLMLARDGQLNDVHLDVRHDVPSCSSRETFKSILDGRGKVVFDGKIVVAQDAQKSDAALANHNLMLARSAEVDTKPQLEIYADDVKCSHGTTVGELDADALFYLRSRGIPQDQATRLLCQAFAQDVLDEIRSNALRERAMAVLNRRLAGAAAQVG